MDTRRFDTIAKSVARPASRRRLLRLLGGGGAAAALAGALTATRLEAQAAPCTIAFSGTVRLGPSANQLLTGNTYSGRATCGMAA